MRRIFIFIVAAGFLVGCDRGDRDAAIRELTQAISKRWVEAGPAKTENAEMNEVAPETKIMTCAEGQAKLLSVEGVVRDNLLEGMLSRTECDSVLIQSLKDLSRDKQGKQVEAWLMVMNKHPRGAEIASMVFHRLLIGSEAVFFNQRMDRVLNDETRDHIFARAFLMSITTKDEVRIKTFLSLASLLPDAEKQQIIGYALFINSANPKSDYRAAILEQAGKLGLENARFEGLSDEVERLKVKLDEIVTGQEEAKVALAVAIRNHYQRLSKGLKKSNILVLGPSGSGKTLMVQTIAESLDAPFVVADASAITQAGYIGSKVKDAVTALVQKANFDMDKVAKGIIFFDEIDKMAARSGRADNEEFKRQAQATLLKVIEGIEIEIPNGRYDSVTVNTSKILIVCAGAFTGLDAIVSARLEREQKAKPANILSATTSDDLIAFGMTPELLGRLPNLLSLRELNVGDLEQILKNPRASVLEEYRTIFASQNIELIFDDAAIRALAEKAGEFRIGARALRTVVERAMAQLQFRIGHMGNVKSCTITERVIKYGDLPLIAYR